MISVAARVVVCPGAELIETIVATGKTVSTVDLVVVVVNCDVGLDGLPVQHSN